MYSGTAIQRLHAVQSLMSNWGRFLHELLSAADVWSSTVLVELVVVVGLGSDAAEVLLPGLSWRVDSGHDSCKGHANRRHRQMDPGGIWSSMDGMSPPTGVPRAGSGVEVVL